MSEPVVSLSGSESLQLFRRGGAVISDDGVYRYRLWRVLDDSSTRTMTFVMLNPSTADTERNDPTIRRCIGFARREGCNRLDVVNLYAYRATNPAVLLQAAEDGLDVVGPDNEAHWADVLPGAAVVVVAWGSYARLLPGTLPSPLRYRPEVMCLGRTKHGRMPRHPLYVRGDQPLERWP